METKMNRDPFPETDSIRALAEFWDTYEVTDYEDDLEEVTEPVFARTPTIQIDLKPEEFAELESNARARGVEMTELVRMWIRDHLQAS